MNVLTKGIPGSKKFDDAMLQYDTVDLIDIANVLIASQNDDDKERGFTIMREVKSREMRGKANKDLWEEWDKVTQEIREKIEKGYVLGDTK